MNTPACPKCGKNEWTPIPDSLALCCECGEVIVANCRFTEFERGASLQEWAADLAAMGKSQGEGD